MNPGNTTLVDYGIQNEESDIRAHVCVNTKKVYVFPTSSGQRTIDRGIYKKVPVHTKGITTATGYLVPPDDIDGLEIVDIPNDWMNKVNFKLDESTTRKGNKAVAIVKGLIKHGMFPLGLESKEITDMDMQIKGLDIVIDKMPTIQVKCDYKGGHRHFGGTGNLFLQVSECNPFGQY